MGVGRLLRRLIRSFRFTDDADKTGKHYAIDLVRSVVRSNKSNRMML